MTGPPRPLRHRLRHPRHPRRPRHQRHKCGLSSSLRPLPEIDYWGQSGKFRVVVFRDERPSRIIAGVTSTNPAVLTLRPNGDSWDWRVIGPGAATIEVRLEDEIVLAHEVRTPMPTHDVHNVMLRAVRVPEEWAPFVNDGRGGWAEGVALRESPNLKYFEAAIWLGERAVHLYEFDNSFDPLGALVQDISAEEFTAYRESFRVMALPGLPLPPPGESYSAETSRFLRDAFQKIASYLVSRYPDSAHHLNFHGHGASGGRLLEAQMFYDDANEFLAHWTAELGRPLGVIDMGGPCNKGGYEDLTNFCQHARYYVASDMPQGGYEFDDWSVEKFYETLSELQYHRQFAQSPELYEALVERVDLNRKSFEYSRRTMTENEWQQATYLYSCREFEPFAVAFRAFLESAGAPFDGGEDLLVFLQANDADNGLIEGFRQVIAHRVDNRDFFAWSEDRNGITMPTAWWWRDMR